MQEALIAGYVNGYKTVTSQLQREIVNGLISEDNAREARENYIYSEIPKRYRKMTIAELMKEGYFCNNEITDNTINLSIQEVYTEQNKEEVLPSEDAR